MPLRVIITAAKTVSRASAEVSPPPSISVTISADLDHGDRDRQQQRAERLADPVRDDLGVVDGGQHRRRRAPTAISESTTARSW